jgi:hypothetical protein
MKNLASAALLLLSMVLTPHLAQAATYCVDKTIDGAPDHTRCSAACAGTCSLRDAITAVDIVGGTTTISIRPGTYTIGGTTADRGEDTNLVGDYDITNVDPLIIEGDGALTTIIDGGGIDRVFHVLQTSAAKVTIRDLTVTNGDPGANGGGLAVESEAAFERLVVKSNSSVGIGGGIAYTGGESISLASSSVFDNFTTGDGGGIGRFGGAPVGDFRATNVTIAGNRADGAGGGMIAAQVFLKNVTIFGNTADDDGSNGALEDGGGIYALVGVDVRNSIIAGNTDASTGGGATVHSDCLGTIDSSAFTLYGKNTGCTITVSSNDQVGTGASPIDPFLDSVLDIFGGETPVLRLKNGSTAVNAGDPAGCKASDGVTNLTEDQRGFTRPASIPAKPPRAATASCGPGWRPATTGIPSTPTPVKIPAPWPPAAMARWTPARNATTAPATATRPRTPAAWPA